MVGDDVLVRGQDAREALFPEPEPVPTFRGIHGEQLPAPVWHPPSLLGTRQPHEDMPLLAAG